MSGGHVLQSILEINSVELRKQKYILTGFQDKMQFYIGTLG